MRVEIPHWGGDRSKAEFFSNCVYIFYISKILWTTDSLNKPRTYVLVVAEESFNLPGECKHHGVKTFSTWLRKKSAISCPSEWKPDSASDWWKPATKHDVTEYKWLHYSPLRALVSVISCGPPGCINNYLEISLAKFHNTIINSQPTLATTWIIQSVGLRK